MVKAKPYHGLLPHLEDAVRVFQTVWEQHQTVYQYWCEKNNQDVNQIYHLLQLGVFLHDIGKANSIWQQYLMSNQARTHVSHPLLSFVVLWELFVQWEGPLFLKVPQLRATLTSVLAHHHMLHEQSYQHTKNCKPFQLPAEIVNDIIQHYLTQSKGKYKSFQSFTQDQLTWTGFELARRVEVLRRLVEDQRKSELRLEKALHTFFLSVICLCDNASSAVSETKYKQGNLVEDQPSVDEQVLNKLATSWLPNRTLLDVENHIFSTPNHLQRQIVENIYPYMVLRAGCGEGKTGAALTFARYWLSQHQVNRVIFTLPTRFTVNSMFMDFQSPQGYNIPSEILGLYHSESAKVLTSFRDDQEALSDAQYRSVQDETFRSNFYHHPITISTIDHLLYSLLHSYKYADRAFGNLQQSVVIFDELHYYQEFTLQKIGECMRLLKQLQIPHLLMSATLPDSFLKNLQKIERKNPYVCVLSSGKTQDQQRMKTSFMIEKASEPLYDPKNGVCSNAMSIIDNHLHTRQMIVVNQVEKAKRIAHELQQLYPDHNIICYHSEFTPIDRQNKEKCIKVLFKSSKERTDQEKNIVEKFGYLDKDAVILVTTQICELSLDISCDIQLNDLAPIDALSQRGGRLHRNGIEHSRKKCDCNICKQRDYLHNDFVYRQIIFPLDEENKNAGYPYVDHQDWIQDPTNLLKRSWEIIGEEYSFPKVVEWVDQLYENFPPLSDEEMKKYIYEDAVFGKQPIERYGKDYNADESEGTFQVRQSQYRTVDVIPGYYQKEILQEIMEIMEKQETDFINTKLRKELFNKIQNYTIAMKVNRFRHSNEKKLVNKLSPVDGLDLLFVHVPYDAKGIGFNFHEEVIRSAWMV